MKAHLDHHGQRPITSSASPSYALVSDQSEPTGGARRRSKSSILAGASLVILLISLVIALLIQTQVSKQSPAAAGLSSGEDMSSYNWSNAMLTWQRTAFHFQPEKNWMNDPNGPLYHKGYYHFFYQYNPYSAVWGNMSWGHAVSTDLIHWKHLPVAMVRDEWYDINGVFTGSATLLPDGRIMMIYTGVTDKFMQVQNLAYPANLSDPLLLDWVKYPGNPVLQAPHYIDPKDFRDPTTAWAGPDGPWKIMVGTKVNGTTGISLVFRTNDFISYEPLDRVMHAVPGTGMWECPDFFPVSTTGSDGLDTSSVGPDIKHVFMVGLYDETVDYYAIGSYDPVNDKWTPDDRTQDIGVGLRVDYGTYYASKSFFDQVKERRILYGWVPETDSQNDDRRKGWAALQTIPREVILDGKTGTNLLQWPVEEIESLRVNFTEIERVEIGPGALVPINIGMATQLDIVAEFEIEEMASTNDAAIGSDDASPYNPSAGAAHRGTFGPFGIVTVADDSLSELTPIYFYISKDAEGNATTWFCADGYRSSKATSVQKRVYGGAVPVLDGENFSMRVLVDHSIVESFGQGGRTVITSRVYPTQAIDGNARLFVFNNATGLNVKASLQIWHLNSAFISNFHN